MTDRIRQRITVLEQQLREQTERRNQAHAIAAEATNAVAQLQGALAALRDLLTDPEDPPA